MRAAFSLVCLSLAGAQNQHALVLQHATVIDGTGAHPRQNQTVVISGTRILAIGASERIRVPDGAQMIDGSGKYVIPGLWDMHVHMRGSMLGDRDNFIEENEDLLPLYLAQGVTGVREMGGDMVETVLKWRKEIAEGRRQGPRIVTCGPKLDGSKPTWPGSIPITTPAEAVAAVRHVKEIGAEFVKVYNTLPNIPRDAYFAILGEAKKQGLRVTGHLTQDIRFAEAAEAGQDFEHIQSLLRACTTRELELAAGMWQTTIDNFDPGSAKALVGLLVHYGTWVTPTLDVSFAMANPAATPDPRTQYLPAAYLDTWLDRRRDPRNVSRPVTPRALLDAQHKKSSELTKLLHDGGVPLLAGSDTGASNGHKYPGFSLHDELARMVEAGLSPSQALQTATWNAAKWQGRLESLGSIESGKLADLVLLDANPLDDIRNTKKIHAVVANGTWFDRARLDAMMATAKRKAQH
jgi:imidazolonepropionase-like amidohydrolase